MGFTASGQAPLQEPLRVQMLIQLRDAASPMPPVSASSTPITAALASVPRASGA